MSVVGENLLDAHFPADIHRDAIGQAIAFVEASFVKFEAVKQCRFRIGNDIEFHIFQNVPDEETNLFPKRFAVFAKKIEHSIKTISVVTNLTSDNRAFASIDFDRHCSFLLIKATK